MLVLQCISKIISGCAVVNPPYSTEIITVPDGSGRFRTCNSNSVNDSAQQYSLEISIISDPVLLLGANT